MHTKESIRKIYLSQRDAISSVAQTLASARICQKILALHLYQTAKHIAFYHAIGKEICLETLLLDALHQHKHVYLPVIQPHETLHFVAFQREDLLTLNAFNILEPIHQHPVAIQTLDLLLAPLVAFDKTGVRLGRGKGYYDKTFMYSKPKKIIGIAYACQYYPNSLPHDAWDIPLDGVITEETIEWFS